MLGLFKGHIVLSRYFRSRDHTSVAINYLLVIVDTTAAHTLYIVGQYYAWSLCSSLKVYRFVMNIFTHIS